MMLMLGIYGAQAQLIKEKEPIDQKYLAGAVPEVDGRVVFSREISLARSMPADSLKSYMARWVNLNINSKINEQILKRTAIARDASSPALEVGVVQYIIFKNAALSLDRSQIIYHLILEPKEKSVVVTMQEISYYYEEERSPEKYTAEEMIADKVAIKKSGDKFVHGHGKFRMKTIDLFDNLCNSIQSFVTTL